jgi:2-C-methyl-D-erythritol 4-phosphate cytidylyltransferase
MAAGESKRAGTGRNKIYRTIKNESVLKRSVTPFLKIDTIERICIVMAKGEEEAISRALADLTKSPKVRFAEGGKTRQDSVYAGLQELADETPDIVLIHDAARPWVTEYIIESVLEAVDKFGACAPVINATDALKIVNSEGFITGHLLRSETVAAQTPQGFRFASILEAHQKASTDGIPYIDDTEIYSTYIGKVFTVAGDPVNRKITYIHDIEPYE